MINLVILVATVIASPTVHVRVDGDGYLRFVREGRTVYAREAIISIDKGILVGKDNLPLVPHTQVLGDPENIRFEKDGRIYGVYQGSDRLLGKIVIAVFGDDVRPVEDRGWLVSSARPTTGQPGSVGFGSIAMVNTAMSAPQSIVKTPTVTFKKNAEVRTDSFTLGDIAEIDAPQGEREKIAAYQIATTPALGVEYKLTQEMVKGRLKRYGAVADNITFVGESAVTVSRKGQRITHKQFIDQALAEATLRKVQASAISTTAQSPDMVVPEGEVTYSVTAFDQSGSRINVRVDVLVDGKKFNGRLVTIDASVVDITIKIGQTVKLIVRSNSAVVETTGKVKAVDKVTGLITVQATTGAMMIGRVLYNGTIEVTL